MSPPSPLRWTLVLVACAVAGPSTRADDIAHDLKAARKCRDADDLAGAIRHLDAAIARHPELADVPEGRGLASWVRPQPNLAEVYVARADAWLGRGDWDRSLADCTRAGRLKASSTDLPRIAGFAYLGRRDLDRAEVAFSVAINHQIGGTQCYYGRAIAAILARRYDPALADLDHLRAATRAPATLHLRGAIWFCREDYAQALAAWDEAVRLEPANPTARLNRSLARAALKRYDDARADADEAIRLDPQRPLAWINRGSVATHQGRYAEAIADCTEAIRLDPQWAGLYLQDRATARREQGDAAGALADLDRAATSRPDDPAIDRARALILATAADAPARDAPRALDLATRAVDRTHHLDPDCLAALAAAHAALGDFPHAIQAADYARQLPPPDPIEWRLDPAAGQQMSLLFFVRDRDRPAARERLDAALAAYRAGQRTPPPRTAPDKPS